MVKYSMILYNITLFFNNIYIYTILIISHHITSYYIFSFSYYNYLIFSHLISSYLVLSYLILIIFYSYAYLILILSYHIICTYNCAHLYAHLDRYRFPKYWHSSPWVVQKRYQKSSTELSLAQETDQHHVGNWVEWVGIFRPSLDGALRCAEAEIFHWPRWQWGRSSRRRRSKSAETLGRGESSESQGHGGHGKLDFQVYLRGFSVSWDHQKTPGCWAQVLEAQQEIYAAEHVVALRILRMTLFAEKMSKNERIVVTQDCKTHDMGTMIMQLSDVLSWLCRFLLSIYCWLNRWLGYVYTNTYAERWMDPWIDGQTENRDIDRTRQDGARQDQTRLKDKTRTDQNRPHQTDRETGRQTDRFRQTDADNIYIHSYRHT